MNGYPMAAVERVMKVPEVILRAMAKRITGSSGGSSASGNMVTLGGMYFG
ncbi:MAG TPA: hypothetical protein VIG89_05905 [Candidatus Acidoferrales bacterium]